MKLKILLIFLFAFIFSSCRSNSIPTTPTIVASTSELPTVPAISISTITSETEEVEELPLANISDTPTAVAIPTSTAIAGSEESLELSEDFFSKQCRAAGHKSLADFYPNTYFSPNGEWFFISCLNFSDDRTTYPFIVSKTDQGKPLVFSPEILAPDFFEKYSSIWFTPDYWSKDEKNLIVRASLSCPDSFECLYKDGEALYMISLESGDFSILLHPQITVPRFSYAFSISPDGQHLAYVDQSTPEAVYIRDLISNNDKMVNLKGKYLKVGIFAWTSDSKDVAFVGLGSNIDFPTSSLFLLNTTDFSLSILFNDRPGVYFPRSLTSNIVDYWYRQDILYLSSLDHYPLYVNIRTKEIIQAPTSVP